MYLEENALQMPMTTPSLNESTVFWLGNMQQDIVIPWEKFIKAQIPASRLPSVDYHCILQCYPQNAEDQNSAWLKQQPPTVQL